MDSIEKSVEDIRTSLQADGFDLSLRRVGDDGAVYFELGAGADACMDCLVPEDMLVQILEASIKDAGPEEHRVVLTRSF